MEESLLARRVPLWIAGYNLALALIAVGGIAILTTTRQSASTPPVGASVETRSINASAPAADLSRRPD
jgi:hypothetical protein